MTKWPQVVVCSMKPVSNSKKKKKSGVFPKLGFFFCCPSLGCFQCVTISVVRYINNPLFDPTRAALAGTN